MTMLKDYREGDYSLLVDYIAPGQTAALSYKYLGSVPSGGFTPPPIAERHATLDNLPIPRDVMLAGINRMEARVTIQVYDPELFAHCGLEGEINGVRTFCKFLFLESLASEGSGNKKQKRWELDCYIINVADGPPTTDGLATTEATLSVMRCKLGDALYSGGALQAVIPRMDIDAVAQSYLSWVNNGQTEIDHLAGRKAILEAA